MKRVLTGLVPLFAIVVATACSSGGSDTGPVIPGLAGGFTPDQGSPGSDTVSAGQGGASVDLVTVEINVTNVDDVYAAAFDLLFDSAQVTYMGWSAGNMLEQGGTSVQ